MSATAYPFPTNWEQDTAAIMPDLMWDEITDDSGAGDPLLADFPFSYEEASVIKLDQHQNPYGLAPVRGLGAAPDFVQLPGMKTYEVYPGFYGLATELGEPVMTLAREPNTVNQPIDVADHLSVLALGCSTMVISRFRQTAAALLVDGEFVNRNASGTLEHRYKIDDYQTFSPANDGNTGPGWAADPENADPIGDLKYWQTYKLNKGTSAKFDKTSKLLCNPQTVLDFWNTKRIRDAFRTRFGANVSFGDMPNLDGPNSLNEMIVGMGLPALVPYEKGYYATLAAAISEDPDQFTYAIPDKALIWVGTRPKGQKVGAWKLTRHAGISAYQANKYPSVDVASLQKAELAKGIYFNAHWRPKMPHGYDIEVGFNTAPILYYRRAVAGIRYT